MEEDAGKLVHEGAMDSSTASFVDLNRAGVPLMEIVSEPDMRSPEEARAYMQILRDLLVYLGVCDGNMEEGLLRCDANVSVRPRGETRLGTRTEIKNLNSFRHVARGLEHEIARQVAVLETGGAVVQETRLWNADRGETAPLRSKEEAHDFRYFPEPDLPPLVVDALENPALTPKAVSLIQQDPDMLEGTFGKALNLILLGEAELALGNLEKAVAEGDSYAVHMKRMNIYAPLRENPRFQALLAKMNMWP